MDPPESYPAPRLRYLRRRTTALFLGGVGLGTTGLTAAIIVSTLAAAEISESSTWSGMPSAFSILGTAIGTSLLAEAMRRWGRRNGLVGGYILAIAGATIAIFAVLSASLLLLILGMFTIGLGRSGDSLSRYLVADLHPVSRRASAIGWMVWMGTIGAVLGPNSLEPAGQVAQRFGLPALSGAYLVTLVAYGLVVLLYGFFMRPDPSTLVLQEIDSEPTTERSTLQELFRLPRVRVALAVLVIGHVVMVLIMTMTPLNLKQAGHGLDAVGLVMSSHIVGMFALSPLTGRLVDDWGQLPVILLGLTTLLLSAVLAFVAPIHQVGFIAFALFLLGVGWNFGFVAGSALLSSGIKLQQRARLQGTTDSLIWASAALASGSSGLLFAGFGYAMLCTIGALLLIVPATVMIRYRETLRQVP